MLGVFYVQSEFLSKELCDLADSVTTCAISRSSLRAVLVFVVLPIFETPLTFLLWC
jgi:hypothetical protein